MKSHERPYGCTFLTCNKTFGSKNDWKRHENSQHFHLETWRCDQERPEGGPCAKLCYRRLTFQEHLVKAHQKEDEFIKSAVQKCRIGRNCQARFWCGFCIKLVELKKGGLDAWTERFDHIDDHFMGRHNLPKQSIQDWVPVDSNKQKGDVQSPHSLGSPDEEFTTPTPSSAAVSPISKSPWPSSPSSVNQASHPLPGKYANTEYPTPDFTATKSALPSKILKAWHHDFEESVSRTRQPEEIAQIDGDLESTVPTDPTDHTKSTYTWGQSSLKSFTTIESKGAAKLKPKSSTGPSHEQELLAITSNKTNIPVEEGHASSSYTPVPALASLVAKVHEEGFVLGVYHKCSSILAKAVAIIMKLKPEIIDKNSASMLRSSSDLFFLWGENFQLADLDFIMDWSCDLKDAIIQYVMDISEALIKSTFFRLLCDGMPPIQEKVEELVDFIRLGVGWDLDVGNIKHENEQEEEYDDGDDEEYEEYESAGRDEEETEGADWEAEDEALNFAKDVDNSVRCLMDLIPSMEQVKASRGRENWNHLTGTK